LRVFRRLSQNQSEEIQAMPKSIKPWQAEDRELWVGANKGTKSFTAFRLIYFTMSYEEGRLRKFRWK